MMSFLTKKTTLPLCLILSTSFAEAAITFTITFTAQAQTDYSAAEKQLFTDGLAYWDSIIDGHQDNANRNFTLNVDSFSTPASGGAVTLGSAGPSGIVFTGDVGANTNNGRFIVAADQTNAMGIFTSAGTASFNTHPDAGALRADVILHEIGHALGIGTLWEDNEVHNDGIAGNHNRTGSAPTGQYSSGTFALLAYQNEFDAGATFIPIEQGGGPGTANGHWNEVDNGQVATGITDSMGRDFRDEVMTGWASPNQANTFVSNTTIQSLRDIGFTLHAQVPEPSTTGLIGLGAITILLRRRK